MWTLGAMFIPFELVEFLLDKDLTAHEAYLVVFPLLEDNNLLYVCRPLIEFLQVASMQPTSGNHHPLTLQDQLGKADYPVHPAVINQRHTTVIYHLLMVLMPINNGRLPDTFDETLDYGLTNIAVKMHTDRRDHETRVS
jgi:hypothetical protein